MIDIYIVTFTDGTTHCMVKELQYYKFLLAAKSLVEAQRKALRSKDKEAVQKCKERERVLLDMVSKYEAWRVQYVK